MDGSEDRPYRRHYRIRMIRASPKHARGCARRVNKSDRAVRRPVAGNLDRAADVIPGGRVGCLPFDEQFVLLDKLKRLVDLSGVFVRAQPGRLRDADG